MSRRMSCAMTPDAVRARTIGPVVDDIQTEPAEHPNLFEVT